MQFHLIVFFSPSRSIYNYISVSNATQNQQYKNEETNGQIKKKKTELLIVGWKKVKNQNPESTK